MKTTILALIPIIFMLISSFGCKKSADEKRPKDTLDSIDHVVKFTPHVDKEGGYSVVKSKIVAPSTKTMKTPTGKELTVHISFFNVLNDVFSVHWYERDTTPGNEAKELQARLISTAKRMGGLLKEVRPVKINGNAGLRATMLTPAKNKQPGGAKLMLLVLTPKRFYLVLASLKSEKNNRKNGERFISSFSLLP